MADVQLRLREANLAQPSNWSFSQPTTQACRYCMTRPCPPTGVPERLQEAFIEHGAGVTSQLTHGLHWTAHGSAHRTPGGEESACSSAARPSFVHSEGLDAAAVLCCLDSLGWCCLSSTAHPGEAVSCTVSSLQHSGAVLLRWLGWAFSTAGRSAAVCFRSLIKSTAVPQAVLCCLDSHANASAPALLIICWLWRNATCRETFSC